MGKRAIAAKTNTKKRHSPAKPRAARSRKPQVLLVGTAHRTRDLKAKLQKIKADFVRVPDVAGIEESLGDNTLAVVLVSPLPRLRLAGAVSRTRALTDHGDVAIFALATDGISGSEARLLYQEGATAVIEWPQERFVFPRLLVELLAVDLVHGSMTEPDAALARTIRAHLKMVRGYGRQLRVRVDAGVAFITGSVEHLWQKEQLEAVVADVPGVRSVVLRWLHVEPSPRPDAQVRRAILRLLKDASDIDESTLAVSVDQGYVTLAGSVIDRRELNRVRRLITNVKGVRNIERLAVVSPSQKQRDHVVARRLRRTLSRLYGDYAVQVSHFAGVAILTGQVDRLRASQQIQATLEDDDAVERVVNKIEVVNRR